MTAIRVKANVPEDRVVTLKLPPEVPVGEVEFELALKQPEPEAIPIILSRETRPCVYRSRPTHPKLAAEYDAFQRLLPELMKRFQGRYVVLHDGVVIADADTEVQALTAAENSFPGVFGYVRRVTDQPEPVERLPNYRIVDKR